MRKLKTIMQGMLHPRSPRKRRLWSMGVVLFFCAVCLLLATGAIPSSAFAAGDAPSQQRGRLQSQISLDASPTSQIYGPPICTTAQTNPTWAAQCANFRQNQAASATWTPNNQNIQNPIAVNSTLMFFTAPAYTSQQPQVSQLWGAMLGIVDCFIVVVLMLHGIVIMLGGSVFRYSKAIEAIPRVLLALIVAQLSMGFITLMLGLNNVLSKQLYDWTGNHLQTASQQTPEVCQKFDSQPASQQALEVCQRFEWSGSGDINDNNNWSAVDTTSGYDHPPKNAQCIQEQQSLWDSTFDVRREDCTWPKFTITPQNVDFTTLDVSSMMKSVPNALDLMIDIMALMLIAQVVIRIFFIDLYIVFAPMGIACWAMPADIGRGLTGMWFKGFISTVMVQFVQMTAIIVTQLILGSLIQALTGPGQISTSVLAPAILTKLVNVALVWFIFRIPSMFNTAPMRSMVEIGHTMSQTANAFVGMQMAEYQAHMSEAFGLGEGAAGIVGMGLMSRV